MSYAFCASLTANETRRFLRGILKYLSVYFKGPRVAQRKPNVASVHLQGQCYEVLQATFFTEKVLFLCLSVLQLT